jgi:hypothetical protein
MKQTHSLLDQRMQGFRRKYYTDKIARGALILTLLVSSILFVVLLSEGLFGFSAGVRTTMVFGLGAIFLGVLGYMVIWPVTQLMNLSQTISDFQIADMVRTHFPNINDKLVNLLQLKSSSEDNSLALAAIDKKTEEIVPVEISSAINLKVNLRYLWWLALPIGLFLLTSMISPGFLGSSSERLVNYDKEFLPEAPFQLSLNEIPDQMVAGESYELKVDVDGSALPSELFIYIKDDSDPNSQFIDYSLNQEAANEFAYTLSDVKEDFSFYVGNIDARSEKYAIEVLKRPFIKNFRIHLNYPNYTGLASETLEDNVGDFKVVKGTSVRWELLPNTEVASAWFVSDEKTKFDSSEEGYEIRKRVMKDLNYFISLESENQITNIDTVKYKINVLQDRYPSIYVFSPNNDFLVDLDPVMPLELEIADDYGFTKMALYYRFTKSGGTTTVGPEYQTYPLEIDAKTLLQPRDYRIDLTALGLKEGDELEYFIKVWDNDGVSGAKASTSATFKVVYPTLDAKYDEVGEQQDQVKENLDNMKQKADELGEKYKKLQETLLEQKKLSFDDKKEMQRILEEHQQMMKELEETQKAFEETKEELQNNQMISEQTLEKYEELNEFLEEMDNPEIEELLKELEEKMEQLNPEDIMNKMEQLRMNDEDIKKSLERTLELFKQMEVDQKTDELRNKIDNMKAKQDVLNEQLEKAETPEEMQNISDRQEDLEKQMDGVKEDLEELGEMKDDTQTPDEEQMGDLEKDAEETQDEMQEASEQMEQSSEQMQEGGRKNKKEAQQGKQQAGQKQKNASKKLQEMSEQLSSMQMSGQMQQDQQNLESLRELLENLLTLSFDQEDLKEEVKGLKYGDPALKEKSQQQKKLQDDMGLVSDSLDALANRLFQIQKFVLDESEKITENMKKSQHFFRNKQVPMISYHQQTAMTSVNNLANMLSDVMQQVQQQMMSAKPGNGMCQKPGQSPSMQKMSEQQKQLNQQMQQMMQGQMDPQKLGEMAARQEAIRKQLEEARNKMNKNGEKGLGDMEKIMQDMKETETELINKQLTFETIKRQQQILSRLLQADRSVRERELDNKRESKTARAFDNRSPEELSLEEYRNKIRQEMLKSNKLEYSNDFLILIEQYFKKLEEANE